MSTPANKIIEVLARGTGLEHAAVQTHATALNTAGLFPREDEVAGPNDASNLLLGLLSGVEPGNVASAVEEIGGLNLDSVVSCCGSGESRLTTIRRPGDAAITSWYERIGGKFGNALADLLSTYAEEPWIEKPDFERVVVGRSGGRWFGKIDQRGGVGKYEVSYVCHFGAVAETEMFTRTSTVPLRVLEQLAAVVPREVSRVTTPWHSTTSCTVH